MSTTQFEQIQALHDQLDQTSEWFSQINQLVGADPEEPAVNSVADYVHKARLDKEVLEIVRDENEVNKKNIFKFSAQIGELKDQVHQLGLLLEQTATERNRAQESEKELLDRRDELLEELEKHQDPTENEKRLLAQQQKGFMAEIEKLKASLKIDESLVKQLARKCEDMLVENECLKVELQQEKDGRCADLDELESENSCDFCDKEREVLTKRDAGYDEWTCRPCHKEQYPEQYVEIYDGQALIDAAK